MAYKKDYSKDKELNSKIVELHINQKVNFKETARTIGISREKAKRHLEAAGYKIRAYSRKKELDSSFARKISFFYYNHKLTQREIAKKLNCGRKKIMKYMKAFKMKTRNSNQYLAEKQELMHKRVIYWYKRVLMVSSVAKIEGIPYSTTYSILNRNNILDRYKNVKAKRKKTPHHKSLVSVATKNREKYREFANEIIKRKIYKKIKAKFINKINEFQIVQQIETQEVPS